MPAANGDKVQIHYKGTLEDGTLFDSSEGKDPLAFEIGSGQVIPGFDEGVRGMEVGDKKSLKIEPSQAYGEVRQDLVFDYPKNQLPNEIKVELGQRLQMTTQDGQPVPVTISSVATEHVTLDANHPLAGETLNFEVELISVG